MKLRSAAGLALAIVVGAAALSGCAVANSAVDLTSRAAELAIGEDSGSGKWQSRKQSFAESQFDSIEVNAAALDILITRSASDQAEVELLTDKTIDNRIDMDASIRSRQLRIRVTEAYEPLLLDRSQAGLRKLVIALPDKTFDQVNIRSEFGHVEAVDLRAESTRVELAAGAIRFSGVSGELDLKTEAGNIEVENFALESGLSARTSAGDITVKLTEPPKAAHIDLQSEIGTVAADLDDLRYRTNRSNRIAATIGSGGPRFEASTSAGHIFVR
jgi:DUF4097 and DUF4098 domain-containing protein YvlB